MIVLAFVLTGTARASSTSVIAEPANATVIGTSPVTMGFPIERLGDLGYDTWLHYETENGSAVGWRDYTTVSGELELPAGELGVSVPVQALGATAFSPDKQFALKLLGASGVGPTPSFAERVSFAAGGTIAGRTKVADMNGDGKPDLVVTITTGQKVALLLNTTAPGSSVPSLAAPQYFAVGTSSEVATPTDINGDGLPDLLVTSGENFYVLINTTSPGSSTLSFTPQQVFEAGRGPTWPILEDVNGDGRPDLIIVNDAFDEQAISVFFNTTPPSAPTVSFQPRQYFEFFSPGRVAAADVNGDGRPDLIVSAQAPVNEVFVILNATPPGASNLSLGGEANYPVGETPNEVRVADLNGDGRPDLAVSNLASNSASVLLNGTAPGALTPNFAPQQSFAVGNSPRSIRAVDLNGDGRIDLITGNHGNHSLSVLLNTTATGASALSFAIQTVEAEPIPLGLVTTDLNGDGRQDLIYTRESGKLLVSLNTTAAPTASAPSLAAKHDAAAGGHPSSVATTDFNNDGKPDLAIANRDDDTASVLFDTTAPGTSTPSFTAQQTFAVGNAPSGLATDDFNIDGKPDLVVADEFAETVSVLFNTTEPGAGTPSFTARHTFSVGETPSAVATADFNGDGKPDLVVSNHDEGTASVLLNSTAPGAATPSFTAQQSFDAGEAPSAVVAADFNGDGKLDPVVANHDEDTVSVFFNTTTPGPSTPSFAAQQSFATAEHPSAVKAADLNGDGRPDLVVADEGSDSASVLLNTTAPGAATPSFATQQTFAAGDAPSAVATLDLSGDGVPDLLVANKGADTASVQLNTTAPGAATPSFATQQTFATGDAPSAVTTADFNGDGGPDVVSADGDDAAISALLDTQYAASISPASVTGTIHYAIPQASLSPVPLSFGNQLAGSSASRIETLSNTGGADLEIQSIAIGGADPSEFSQQNPCPPTLSAGASCAIDVTFAPKAAAMASVALTVTSNAPSSPDSVALSGSGIAATPPPLSAHTLTVKLKGGGEGRVDGGAGAISCPTVCSHDFADGMPITLTATPALGSRFAGWSAGGCTNARICQLTIGADTTLSARYKKVPTAPSRSRVLVSYRQEGGIGGPRPSLVITKDGRARATSKGCTAKFALGHRTWNRLRAALRGAHLHAIAGNYPPPKDSADEITYVIKAGGEVVRIALPQPEHKKLMRLLRPLLKVLNRLLSAGERRSCTGAEALA